MTIKRVPLAERFWPKVAIGSPTDCWEYIAFKDKKGYGYIGEGGHRGRHLLAHRVAYELTVGQIPEGMTIDHLCKNTSCVNPAHLEAVTLTVNLLRGDGIAVRNSRKTHCPYGHTYSGTNLRGDRRCNACDARRTRDYHARLKAAGIPRKR